MQRSETDMGVRRRRRRRDSSGDETDTGKEREREISTVGIVNSCSPPPPQQIKHRMSSLITL